MVYKIILCDKYMTSAGIALNPLKVGIFGLDNAGKTTIVKIIQGEQDLDLLATLQPTVRVQIEKLSVKTTQWVMWDFGGQDAYRGTYLETPQEFFDGLDLLVYVIDVQDVPRFNKVLDYFTNCLEQYRKFSPGNPAVVFLHKYDPDLIKMSQMQMNLRYLHREVLQIARDQEIFIRLWSSTIFDSKLRLIAMMGGNIPKTISGKKLLPQFIQAAKKTHARLSTSSSFETQLTSIASKMGLEINRDQKLKQLSLERKRILDEFKAIFKKHK